MHSTARVGGGPAGPDSAGASGGPGGSSAFGVAVGPQLLDEAPQLVEAPAEEANDHRAVEPVQKLPATPAAHQEGDKVSRLPMVQDLHATPVLRKGHTGNHLLQ
jgi:hypothetical protein